MNKIIRFAAIPGAIALLVSQFAQATPPAAAQRRNLAIDSVRPTTDTIRVAVSQVMGWQVGVFGSVFQGVPFTQAAVLDNALGLTSIAGDSRQQISPQSQDKLDVGASSADIALVKQRLADLGLKMTAYRVESIPDDEAGRQRLLAFAHDLGASTLVTAALPSSLSALDSAAQSSGMKVAILSQDNPTSLMQSIRSLSPAIGVDADFAAWMEHGVRPVDGLALVKDRLMVVQLRDRSRLGGVAHDVRLGTGVADLQRFLLQVAEAEPQPVEHPDACVNCGRPYGGTKALFIALDLDPWQIEIPTGPQPGISGDSFATLWQEATDFEKAVRPAMGYRVDEDALMIPIASTARLSADLKQKIDAAVPHKATVEPLRPRKLLVIDLCPAGGYYHDTIANADYAIQKMADDTGAFTPVFSNDLNNLKYPNILKYDAVFLNSIVGEVFADPEVLNGLLRFVHEGGGVAGVHGSTYASMDLPAFGNLMGAQSGPHRVETVTLKIDDLKSPLTKQFASSPLTAGMGGDDFTWTDEFYHFLPTGPYSRDKLHVLISIDDSKTDLSPWHVRPDEDYASVWVKRYGAGRVFNCALGHTNALFTTPATAEMIFNGIQFVLGDLHVDTTPSSMTAVK